MILRLIRTEDEPSTPPTPSPPPGDNDITIMSPPQPPLGCPSYTPFTLQISASLATAMTPDNIAPFYSYIEGIAPAGYFANMDFQPTILNMVSSEVPTSSQNNVWFDTTPLGTSPCKFYVTVTYAGSQPQNPSVPGVVIEEPPPPPPPTPPPVMPPPPEPPILRECRQRITDDIQRPVDESGYILDRLKSQATGQIDYQLAQVEPALAKMTQKIDANIINTMSEVYSGAYQVGLGIPSTEQIMAGEPVYSPYGIGADQPLLGGAFPIIDSALPYCDTLTPTPTPTPTTGGPGPRPDYPTPTPTPTPTTPPPTNPPGVSCPAPVVQCPDPPDIIFKPNIVVNIPKQDGTNVTVNVDIPDTTEPTTGGGYPVPPSPTEPPAPTEPSPSPSPSPSPTPTPTPDKPPPPSLLSDLSSSLTPGNMGWENGEPCNAPPNSGNFNSDELWNAFGWKRVSKDQVTPPEWLQPANWNTLIRPIANFGMGFIGRMIQVTNDAVRASVPIFNNWQDFQVVAWGGIAQTWLGIPILEFMKGSIYNINYNNPQSIPSEAECVNLFLAGEIDENTMRCLVRANGSYDSWYGKIANSGRTKLSNDQIIQLRRRGILDDPTTNLLMRGNGVIDEQEQLWMYKATEAMPSVSDIVRFMVRDADDKTVADKYGTDAQLDKKYGPQLQAWARGQGITDEVLKYYWRSHWEIPSNTALFEMLHRLRPDRRTSPVPADVVVTMPDVQDALVVNDVLPYWAKRLIEISYKPLTRTDTQRAYFIDAISEDELYDSYRDLGYNNDNAMRLVKFTNQLKSKRKQTTGGTEKAMSVLKYYKNFLLTDSEATARLRNGGLSEKAAVDAMQIASKQRSNDSQLACIKGVHSKYKRFIYGDNDARKDLIAIGVPLENIDKLIANWNCERANKPKELSAAQVCKAYKQELIDKPEYIRRLNAIGYDVDDANVIFEICTRPPPLKPKLGEPGPLPKTQAEKDAQTEAARAITAAAMLALNPPLEP